MANIISDTEQYQNITSIYESKNSQVYRAVCIKDKKPVILKVLNEDYPKPEQIRRYKQEYHLANQLDLSKVIKATNFEKWDKKFVIVFEDIGGISLKGYLSKHSRGLPIHLFLSIAIQTTEAIGQLHSKKIIHKDINPSNIVINPDTKDLKIIDLGISTRLNQENPSLASPYTLEGTLAYISPEQSGRMNRILDYRTDFYSLGITFYELLTGKLPFLSDDPLELIHFHIAKLPEPPIKDTENIPIILSKMVIKLLEKNAEDRYQSAWGLKTDLEECLKQWQAKGSITEFSIRKNDISILRKV